MMPDVASGGSTHIRTSEAGAFSFMVDHPDEDVTLYVRGADGVAAVKVAKGVNRVKVVLGPSATASGRVVDAAGKPLSGDGPSMSLLGGLGMPRLGSAAYASSLDRDGRYEFKGLIPGLEYRVNYAHRGDSGAVEYLTIKTFRVDAPGPIDLGTFAVPGAKP